MMKMIKGAMGSEYGFVGGFIFSRENLIGVFLVAWNLVCGFLWVWRGFLYTGWCGVEWKIFQVGKKKNDAGEATT